MHVPLLAPEEGFALAVVRDADATVADRRGMPSRLPRAPVGVELPDGLALLDQHVCGSPQIGFDNRVDRCRQRAHLELVASVKLALAARQAHAGEVV
eukprot:6987005-Pyramimonas_sp.AAC.1